MLENVERWYPRLDVVGNGRANKEIHVHVLLGDESADSPSRRFTNILLEVAKQRSCMIVICHIDVHTIIYFSCIQLCN